MNDSCATLNQAMLAASENYVMALYDIDLYSDTDKQSITTH